MPKLIYLFRNNENVELLKIWNSINKLAKFGFVVSSTRVLVCKQSETICILPWEELSFAYLNNHWPSEVEKRIQNNFVDLLDSEIFSSKYDPEMKRAFAATSTAGMSAEPKWTLWEWKKHKKKKKKN